MPSKVRAPAALATLALAAILAAPAPSQAAFEKDEAEIRRLMADGNYLTVANYYLGYLSEAGQTELDPKIEQNLLALKLTEPKQNGALYFNLARMADTRNDKAEALRRYERSLASFKTMKEPPEGAVPAVMQRIQELGGN